MPARCAPAAEPVSEPPLASTPRMGPSTCSCSSTAPKGSYWLLSKSLPDAPLHVHGLGGDDEQLLHRLADASQALQAAHGTGLRRDRQAGIAMLDLGDAPGHHGLHTGPAADLAQRLLHARDHRVRLTAGPAGVGVELHADTLAGAGLGVRNIASAASRNV